CSCVGRTSLAVQANQHCDWCLYVKGKITGQANCRLAIPLVVMVKWLPIDTGNRIETAGNIHARLVWRKSFWNGFVRLMDSCWRLIAGRLKSVNSVGREANSVSKHLSLPVGW